MHLNNMPTKADDLESEIMRKMFDELTKMIREKHIKLEAIVQRLTENDSISQESFNRVYKILTEHGKKNQWI